MVSASDAPYSARKAARCIHLLKFIDDKRQRMSLGHPENLAYQLYQLLASPIDGNLISQLPDNILLKRGTKILFRLARQEQIDITFHTIVKSMINQLRLSNSTPPGNHRKTRVFERQFAFFAKYLNFFLSSVEFHITYWSFTYSWLSKRNYTIPAL